MQSFVKAKPLQLFKYNLLFKENKSIKIISSKLTLNNDNNKEKKFNLTVMYKLLQKYWKTIILFKMCLVVIYLTITDNSTIFE